MNRPVWDALIVGGGPIGLATAIAARRRGLEVLVIERRQPPLDKACGEGLMPDGVAALETLGVRAAAFGRPFAGIRYIDGPHDVSARFRRPGVGVRRTALHRALVARAEAVGAQLAWGESLIELTTDGLRTDRRRLHARHVIGADGLHSSVRRAAGLAAPASRRRRFGVRHHVEIEPWTDHVEVYWSDHGEAYVTPVDSRTVGVGLLWSGDRERRAPGLESFPELRDRLSSAPLASRRRGAGPFAQRVRAVTRGRVSLVGDAAGYLDAISGEGLAVGVHQAIALADAIADDEVSRYAAAQRRIVARPAALTRILLALAARPRLRRRAVAALADAPELFERLLAIHARDAAPRHFGIGGVARLTWGLIGGTSRADHVSQCVR